MGLYCIPVQFDLEWVVGFSKYAWGSIFYGIYFYTYMDGYCITDICVHMLLN